MRGPPKLLLRPLFRHFGAIHVVPPFDKHRARAVHEVYRHLPNVTEEKAVLGDVPEHPALRAVIDGELHYNEKERTWA